MFPSYNFWSIEQNNEEFSIKTNFLYYFCLLDYFEYIHEPYVFNGKQRFCMTCTSSSSLNISGLQTADLLQYKYKPKDEKIGFFFRSTKVKHYWLTWSMYRKQYQWISMYVNIGVLLIERSTMLSNSHYYWLWLAH